MTTFRQSMLALLAVLSLPARATDYAVEYGDGPPPAPIVGQLNDDFFLGDVDPVFHRPYTACETEHVGNYRYDTITVTNTANGEADVDVEVDTGFCDDAHDSVVYGYSGVFVPADPLENCFVVGDDIPENRCSEVHTTLMPDQSIVFVITSFDPDQTWPWTARFNDRIYSDDFECLSADDPNCAGTPGP